MSAQFSQLRITADDQALAGKILVGKLEQIALVEQVHLDRPGLHELANRPALERRDPRRPRTFAQDIDLLLGDHPAVPDQDHRFQRKILLQLIDLR